MIFISCQDPAEFCHFGESDLFSLKPIFSIQCTVVPESNCYPHISRLAKSNDTTIFKYKTKTFFTELIILRKFFFLDTSESIIYYYNEQDSDSHNLEIYNLDPNKNRSKPLQ